MENQEHTRAHYAWGCIRSMKGHSHEKKYRTLVASLPTRLQTIGLMQTLAFTCSKMDGGGKPEFVKLNLHLLKWIEGQTGADTWNENANAAFQKFTALMPSLGTEALMIRTREAIDLAIWLKRFAEAHLEKDPEG